MNKIEEKKEQIRITQNVLRRLRHELDREIGKMIIESRMSVEMAYSLFGRSAFSSFSDNEIAAFWDARSKATEKLVDEVRAMF